MVAETRQILAQAENRRNRARLAMLAQAIRRDSVRQQGARRARGRGAPEASLIPVGTAPWCGRLPPQTPRAYATAIGDEEVHRPWRLQ